MTVSPILVSSIEPYIEVITINRPEKANTIDYHCLSLLEQAIDNISKKNIKAIIITGSGEQNFCAGADLSFFLEKNDSLSITDLSLRMTKILDELWIGEIPVIAAINGKAFGGGLEILSACHIRIADQSCEFAFRQAKMGVTTGWGGAKRLFSTLSPNTLLYHFLLCDNFDAMQAESWGFVHKLVSHQNVLSEAIQMAQAIVSLEKDVICGFMSLYKNEMAAKNYTPSRDNESRLFSALIENGFFLKQAESFLSRKKK